MQVDSATSRGCGICPDTLQGARTFRAMPEELPCGTDFGACDVVHCPPDSEGIVWLLISREPRPDFGYWPGRRVLAGLDAVAWPLAAVVVGAVSPLNLGVFGAVLMVVAATIGARRLYRALWVNRRYQFTTWLWGKRLAALLLVGLLLKLALQFT